MLMCVKYLFSIMFICLRGIGALRYCLVTDAFFLESTKDRFIHFELFIMFVL